MKKIIQYMLFTAVLLISATQVNAQKIGYMDSAKLLTDLAEVKQADTNLETLGTQLRKRLEGKVQALQAKAQTLQQTYSEGGLSPKEAEVEQQKLAAEEQELVKMEQEMSKQLNEKRQALFAPIYDKINLIIADVAKAEGYDYVIDVSQGVLLYYDEAHDLTAKVKAKL